ncbi:proline-rich protein 2-like [Orycteropus afer afer]|uniref:Proline-rich protein 2-like n=1 Tax=Orycteropus afer afer TaxID=1230840 RepID=A0A8B7BEV5_ORYAF|nr:proline-rich protein 2-like [Orycteropus afer afer]
MGTPQVPRGRLRPDSVPPPASHAPRGPRSFGLRGHPKASPRGHPGDVRGRRSLSPHPHPEAPLWDTLGPSPRIRWSSSRTPRGPSLRPPGPPRSHPGLPHRHPEAPANTSPLSLEPVDESRHPKPAEAEPQPAAQRAPPGSRGLRYRNPARRPPAPTGPLGHPTGGPRGAGVSRPAAPYAHHPGLCRRTHVSQRHLKAPLPAAALSRHRLGPATLRGGATCVPTPWTRPQPLDAPETTLIIPWAFQPT